MKFFGTPTFKNPATTGVRFAIRLACATVLLAADLRAADPTPSPEAGFAVPPPEARVRAYWWWLNGNVTKESITRDLKEMAAKGFGGAVIFDADGSKQDGNTPVPAGPTFFSPAWRELYKHTLREAAKLGLKISLNIQSGWNLGGPMVPAEDAPKKLTWSVEHFEGPGAFNRKLPEPPHAKEFYRDIAVIAYPVNPKLGSGDPPAVKNWQAKTLERPLNFSAPDTSLLVEAEPSQPGEETAHAKDVIDLTSHLQTNGTLHWNAPPGQWEILRIGSTLNGHCKVSTASGAWQGYAIDPYDANAFRRYWNAVVEPLIADAGKLAGTTLQSLHTDSWEVDGANWTSTLREEFQKRRGYDLLPYMPAFAGRIVDDRSTTNRFLNDLRRTMGDLAIANHYQLFSDAAHKHGLTLHCESGGPHAVPIDSLQCLGMDDIPMSEFWARSWKHRVKDGDRFFVKQPASAAHTYGRNLVAAEGFTTIGPHWQETLWDNLKPSFDRAACEGLNRLFWHAFVCSPASMGVPGQQYFAGTHLNPNVTWWNLSAPFFAYLNRCQFLLQQGRFQADALYYYGDQVPNFAQLKVSDPAHVLPGYDYDAATSQVVLERLSVRDGRLVLPDGMSYRVLVLPNQTEISLPVLRKIRQLVLDGATVIGPKPQRANSLSAQPQSDAEVAKIVDELWGAQPEPTRQVGKGRVITDRTARKVLLADGVPPDFENSAGLDYIHRNDSGADIYFVANPKPETFTADCVFRVDGKIPELWDPVTGAIRDLPRYKIQDGRTTIPIEFAPYGSWFVIFRRPAAPAEGQGENFPQFAEVQTLTGPWEVSFDPKWGGPARIEFPELIDWTKRPEPGIRNYSGTAVYRKTFEAQPGATTLDLGDLRELASVRLNGKPVGVLWSKPFRADVRNLLKPGSNKLEVEVVNFWPNRVIGDAALPTEKRFTRTNVLILKADTPLIPSGLFGPVRLLRETK